jgi:putative ATP-dependent endonuclease of the OLD family
MQITKLVIKNFRSFGPSGQTIVLADRLSAFIGLNSSGKTTALEALRKMFGVTAAEREIFREDFHIAEGEDPDSIDERHLSVEVIINFDEEEKYAVPGFFTYLVVDEQGADPYLRIRLESTWKKSHSATGDIDTKLYYIKLSEGSAEKDEHKQICPGYQRSLIEVFYVPAIRRPSEQIKYASGSILYRVLKQIKMDDDFKHDFEEHVSNLNTLFKRLPEFKTIQNTLNSFWEKFHKDERYKESKLTFSGSDIDSILRKLEISFSPTEVHRDYNVDDLGEGYRSLFYLTLVCSLLDFESKHLPDKEWYVQRPLLTLLAIEEPENHISPQLLGRVIKILLGIATQGNSQVLVSSHTPAIIKRLHPESIYHFRIDDHLQTEINRIVLPEKSDDAYKYVKEAVQNYPELYFARLVIIGEGDSEELVFNRLMTVYDKDFDDHFISFVPLGHRFVNHIWKLLKHLHIPYITLLDLDRERQGGGWGRVKYVLKQLKEIGYKKTALLKFSDGTFLSDADFDKMHTWDLAGDYLSGWVNYLEKYHVYFSSPLDIDFLLLETFPDTYKNLVTSPEGPRIPDKTKKAADFDKKVQTAVAATLKSDDVKGLTYSDSQKELMIWYQYHFLGRGKPVTHLHALSQLTDEDLDNKMPGVIKKIFEAIESKINKL